MSEINNLKIYKRQKIYDSNNEFGTLGTNCGSSTSAGGGTVLMNNLRIRKLTPKECWRLMGFTDEEFNRAAKVNSNTQLYKQAGNSIVVDVLVNIFTNLFKDNNDYTIDKFIDEEVNL